MKWWGSFLLKVSVLFPFSLADMPTLELLWFAASLINHNDSPSPFSSFKLFGPSSSPVSFSIACVTPHWLSVQQDPASTTATPIVCLASPARCKGEARDER